MVNTASVELIVCECICTREYSALRSWNELQETTSLRAHRTVTGNNILNRLISLHFESHLFAMATTGVFHMKRVYGTSRPSSSCSFLRTAAFTGNKYVLDLLSGNIDVFHDVSPIVTITGIDPQPRRIGACFFCIAAASRTGKDKKYQAALPE